jgi:hypothetical protein
MPPGLSLARAVSVACPPCHNKSLTLAEWLLGLVTSDNALTVAQSSDIAATTRARTLPLYLTTITT